MNRVIDHHLLARVEIKDGRYHWSVVMPFRGFQPYPVKLNGNNSTLLDALKDIAGQVETYIEANHI